MKFSALLRSALTCVLLAPAAAFADSYTFTLTPTAGGASTVFSLDTAGVPYGADTVFTISQGTSTVFGRVDLFNGGGYAPFDLGLCTNGNGGGCSGTETYFTGAPLDAPFGGGVSILTGIFSLVNTTAGNVETELTIVNNTTAPIAVTPEPSSLGLLATGMLGMVAVVKRRLA